jgi:hypothetical protein
VRLYTDDSVPDNVLRGLIRDFNIEVGTSVQSSPRRFDNARCCWGAQVVVVDHDRKGAKRDHFLASCRALAMDDPTLSA